MQDTVLEVLVLTMCYFSGMGEWKDIAGQDTELQAAGYTALRTKLDWARYLQATLPLVLMQHAPAPCAMKARRGDLFATAA
jgi:hypothetical protein